MLNGKAWHSANISLLCAYSVDSVDSVYSVFYSVYSVILINSANTLRYSVCIVFYSVHIVRYSDLFKLNYSVTLCRLNSSYSVISSLVLLGELNGMLLDIIGLSRGRS